MTIGDEMSAWFATAAAAAASRTGRVTTGREDTRVEWPLGAGLGKDGCATGSTERVDNSPGKSVQVSTVATVADACAGERIRATARFDDLTSGGEKTGVAGIAGIAGIAGAATGADG